MKKIVVYGTADGKFPEEYMEPEIFSTDNSDGMQIYDNRHGGIAVLQRSDNPCPMPWRMYLGGCSMVFFRTYKEAKDFCDQRGYRLKQRGGKRCGWWISSSAAARSSRWVSCIIRIGMENR